MVDNDETVETTRQCLVQDDVSPMQQWQNVVWVSSTGVEESLFCNCDEAAVDYVASGLETPVLYLTGERISFKKDAGPGSLSDSNPHYEESEASEEYIAEETEEPKHLLRRSAQVERMPVRFSDTSLVAVKGPVMYKRHGRQLNERREAASEGIVRLRQKKQSFYPNCVASRQEFQHV